MDGAGKDLSGVLMELIAGQSRIEAKVDGLVSHERMNEVVNVSRQEWRSDIKAAMNDLAENQRSERRAEMSEMEKRIKDEIDRKQSDREKRDADIESRVRMTYLGLAAVAIAGIGYAVYNLLSGG
jgi:phage-related minor tail protein